MKRWKCNECSCAEKGFFSSLPDAYVCTGTKEPFVIYDYPNAKCSVECHRNNNATENDGVYIELFAIKNGIRYNVKTIELKDMANILTNNLLDGIEKLWQ